MIFKLMIIKCPVGNETFERRERKMNEWFCTVFPNDLDEMPQDFESYAEAKEYGDEMFGESNYTIESRRLREQKGELIINV